MDGITSTAILKVVAEYGALGLGWVAWILTMFYLQVERKRYQALVIHIIQHFTQVDLSEKGAPVMFTSEHDSSKPRHQQTFSKLFGKQ